MVAMPDLGREAQARVDRIHAFREQLAELERDQVLALSPEQRARVDDHLNGLLQQFAQKYDVDVSASQKRLSLGMKIVSALGALALAASVFLFFYRFWGDLSTPVQVALLLIAPMAGLAGM